MEVYICNSGYYLELHKYCVCLLWIVDYTVFPFPDNKKLQEESEKVEEEDQDVSV